MHVRSSAAKEAARFDLGTGWNLDSCAVASGRAEHSSLSLFHIAEARVARHDRAIDAACLSCGEVATCPFDSEHVSGVIHCTRLEMALC